MDQQKVKGWYVRTKNIEQIGDIQKRTYKTISRLYHVKSAADEYCELCNKTHGLPRGDRSKFWVTGKRDKDDRL